MTFTRIASTLRSLFFPYRPTRAERRFIDANRVHWQPSASDAKILVEGSLTSPSSLIEKSLIAKTAEELFDAQAMANLHTLFERTNRAAPIFRSFGIVRFNLWWRGYLNVLFILPALAFAIRTILYRKPADLLSQKFDGIEVGDLIYDSLVRFCQGEYTVDRFQFSKHLRLLARAHFTFFANRRLFEKHRIRAVITSHTVYAEYGLLCRIAHARDVPVILKDMDVFRYYGPGSNIREHFRRVRFEEILAAEREADVIEAANVYVEQRVNGKIDQVDVVNAYRSKKLYSRKDLSDLFALAAPRKNVFVLAHAFSDAPHVGEGMPYQDYYQWLRASLRALSRARNTANVFVKPHPSSYMWSETGAVEEMLKHERIEGVHIVPSDFSTASIISAADFVVTAQGTAGLEFSCFGIPATICGKGYYSGFGIAHEYASTTAYENALLRISELAPLNDIQVRRARLALYLTFNRLVRAEIAPSEHTLPNESGSDLSDRHYAEATEKLTGGANPRGILDRMVREAVERK